MLLNFNVLLLLVNLTIIRHLLHVLSTNHWFSHFRCKHLCMGTCSGQYGILNIQH